MDTCSVLFLLSLAGFVHSQDHQGNFTEVASPNSTDYSVEVPINNTGSLFHNISEILNRRPTGFAVYFKETQYHVNCRNKGYPSTQVDRFTVPDDKVPWNVTWDEYEPPTFTREPDKRLIYVDHDNDTGTFMPIWNAMDGDINRISLVGRYEVHNNYPVNPKGRTGLQGRGLLERWGPNPTVTLIITRWKLNKNNDPIYDKFSDKPIIQFVGFKSSANENWAFPSRVIFPGDQVCQTMRRLYYRSVVNMESMHFSDGELIDIRKQVFKFFNKGTTLYTGYVDDSRNTDNAWVETIVKHYHANNHDVVSLLPLRFTQGGRQLVQWVDLNIYTRFVRRQSPFAKKLVLPKFSYTAF